jgi:hypothetical protein
LGELTPADPLNNVLTGGGQIAVTVAALKAFLKSYTESIQAGNWFIAKNETNKSITIFVSPISHRSCGDFSFFQ